MTLLNTKIKPFYFFLFLIHNLINPLPRSITYQKHGGRLGDCLINYLKCRYLARKYQMTLVYRPFAYSDDFAFHDHHPHLNNYRFKKIVPVRTEQKLKHELNKKESDIVYESDYFTELINIQGHDVDYRVTTEGLYDYALKTPSFHNKIINSLKPRFPYQHMTIPANCIAIAVHVRKGIGWDSPIKSVQLYQRPKKIVASNEKIRGYADTGYPTKFPPDQYYVDQLKLISDILGNPPLYVHIFTDAPNPTLLVEQYRKALNKPNITFGWRKKNNHHNKNVIEDFFNMAFHFDILIRSSSSFSWMAQFIGNHKFTLAPFSGVWHDKNILIIDKVELIIPDKIKHLVYRHHLDTLNFNKSVQMIQNIVFSR